jgi:hypothetical protein
LGNDDRISIGRLGEFAREHLHAVDLGAVRRVEDCDAVVPAFGEDERLDRRDGDLGELRDLLKSTFANEESNCG